MKYIKHLMIMALCMVGNSVWGMGGMAGRPSQQEIDEATIELLIFLSPQMVHLIPDSVIASGQSSLVAAQRRAQLQQMIKAGGDLYRLGQDVESGRLSEDLKKKLAIVRDQFKELNGKLAVKSKELKAITEQLRTANTNQRSLLMEQQAVVMLEMSDIMANPLYEVASLLQELNTRVLTTLVQTLESLPPVQPYLMIGGKNDAVPLSGFIKGRLAEMVAYTDAQRKIGANLKAVIENLKASLEACLAENAEEPVAQ